MNNAEARYLSLIKRLGGSPDNAQGPQEVPKVAFDQARIAKLRDEVLQLSSMEPHPRGYAFEAFLTSLFDLYALKPREPFRNRGEQIDGSFVLANETYLLEAKWQSTLTGAARSSWFPGKARSKGHLGAGSFCQLHRLY